MECSFYVLSNGMKLENVLPKLLAKIYSLGHKVNLRVDSKERLEQLDHLLWTTTRDFLPHGTTHGHLQPIYLSTSCENPNQATVLLVTPGADETANNYEKYLGFIIEDDIPLYKNQYQNAKFFIFDKTWSVLDS